ncbi:MAG: hypothetical protein ACK4E0_03005 [Chitinophagaceae bacterium]
MLRPNWLITLSLLVSCGQNTAGPEADPIHQDSTVIPNKPKVDNLAAPEYDSVPPNIQIDSLIHIAIADGQNMVKTRAAIEQDAGIVICQWKTKSPKRLQATIVPVKVGLKLRFSELVYPNKRTEGPFGKSISINLEEPGLYQLKITPNQMAGSRHQGEFELEFRLEDY